MAALQCSALPAKSILGFHRPVDRASTPSIAFLNPPLLSSAPPTYLTSRSKNNVRILLRRGLYRVYASNGTSEGSDVTKSSEAATGPPFLTILAGFVVFLASDWGIACVGSVLDIGKGLPSMTILRMLDKRSLNSWVSWLGWYFGHS